MRKKKNKKNTKEKSPKMNRFEPKKDKQKEIIDINDEIYLILNKIILKLIKVQKNPKTMKYVLKN